MLLSPLILLNGEDQQKRLRRVYCRFRAVPSLLIMIRKMPCIHQGQDWLRNGSVLRPLHSQISKNITASLVEIWESKALVCFWVICSKSKFLFITFLKSDNVFHFWRHEIKLNLTSTLCPSFSHMQSFPNQWRW